MCGRIVPLFVNECLLVYVCVCVSVCPSQGEDEHAGGAGPAAVPRVGPVSVSAA